jgi:hypothetical protein
VQGFGRKAMNNDGGSTIRAVYWGAITLNQEGAEIDLRTTATGHAAPSRGFSTEASPQMPGVTRHSTRSCRGLGLNRFRRQRGPRENT